MRDTQEFSAEGFVFGSLNDAKLAQVERRKIEYLQSHIENASPEDILLVYNKAIEDRIFKTAVGICYMKQVQDYLLMQTEIEDDKVQPIPLYINYEGTIRENTSPAKQRIQPPKPAKAASQRNLKDSVLPVAVFMNIVLVVMIIAMFVITLTSNQPNILNYERVITDKYASWEQELTERERVVREKERALK